LLSKSTLSYLSARYFVHYEVADTTNLSMSAGLESVKLNIKKKLHF